MDASCRDNIRITRIVMQTSIDMLASPLSFPSLILHVANPRDDGKCEGGFFAHTQYNSGSRESSPYLCSDVLNIQRRFNEIV